MGRLPANTTLKNTAKPALTWRARRRRVSTRVLLAILILLVIYNALPAKQSPKEIKQDGPIPELMVAASTKFDNLLKKETKTLKAAAEQYRLRRGRLPPPGFDKWYEYAAEQDTIIIEDFWDQIYDDLAPFWAKEPKILRQQAKSMATISIRNHVQIVRTDFEWAREIALMFAPIVHLVPDLDFAMNLMDEPRVVVPYDDLEDALEEERLRREAHFSLPLHKVHQKLTSIDDGEIDVANDISNTWIQSKDQEFDPYWPIALEGCPSDSPSRKAYRRRSQKDIPEYPLDVITAETLNQTHYYKGFVKDVAASLDICTQPELEFLHGALVNPKQTSYRHDLVPIFSGSKFSTNNDIILPAPKHYSDDGNFQLPERMDQFQDFDAIWPTMRNSVIWRGAPSGGLVHSGNWQTFHRHRFVSMTNWTLLSAADHGWKPQNWRTWDGLPDTITPKAYQERQMDQWTSSLIDTGFTSAACTPTGNLTCNLAYDQLLSRKLHEIVDYRYVPDVDGTSYSARFRAFLLSDGIPIKSTLYKTWSDNRLVEWVHYIPLSTSFVEFYKIIEFFIGYDDPGHETLAKRVARAGREWSERVMRREDMEVYLLRLVLEYTRVLDDSRDYLGYTDDIYS